MATLTLLAANNAETTLSAGINNTATALTVAAGKGALFPAIVSGTSFFKLTLIDAATETLTEIMHVTAVTGDTFTVVRGQEGTTARSWSVNDIVANMVTAGTIGLLAQLFSPTFNGDPKVPTPSVGDNDLSIANTAFVTAAIKAATGRLINTVYVPVSQSYTPDLTKVAFVRVKQVGGGGAGGGTSATAANQIASAWGGNGGVYGESSLIPAASIGTVTCTIGSGGVAASGAVGGNGGATSFGSFLISPGGVGGTNGAAGGAGSLGSDNTSSLASSGSALAFSEPGGSGNGPFNITVLSNGIKSGKGGDSKFGWGAGGINGTTSPRRGLGYGAGGCGNAAGPGAAAAIAGGPGSDGFMIIEEYA